MNPQNNTKFINQLTTFTNLKQLINIKEKLKIITLTSNTTNSTLTTNFIKKHIKINNNKIKFNNHKTTKINFSLNNQTNKIKIKIINKNNKIIQTIKTNKKKNSNTII